MRKATILLLAAVFIAPSASADTCFKIKSHTDANYHHGAMVPAEDSETELWVGEGRMAFIDEDRHLIFNLEDSTLVILEPADSGYVETALPLDLTKIVPPDFVQRLAMFPYTGEVSPLEGTKEVLGRKCRSFMLHHWIDYNQAKYNETERTVWVCDDLGIGSDYAGTWLRTMYTMSNFKPELVDAIVDAGGWDLLSTSVRYSEGQQVKSSREVLEISETEPGDDVYSIPGYFKKKDFINVGR